MNPSPARRLLTLVRYDSMLPTQQEIDDIMSGALYLAYQARLPFADDDIVVLMTGLHTKSRAQINDEAHYRSAIKLGHPSAAVAWETYLKRRPFFVGGRRVWVGKGINYDGRQWTCSTIGDGGIVVVDPKTQETRALLPEDFAERA